MRRSELFSHLIRGLLQPSVPISVTLATLVLNEPRLMQRMAWASVLGVGIVIIVSL
jgi:hypothetical protein